MGFSCGPSHKKTLLEEAETDPHRAKTFAKEGFDLYTWKDKGATYYNMAELESKFVGTLAGQVALVTGASRGLGKGIAEMLAQAGATVYITGRTLDPTSTVRGSLAATAEEIRAKGGKCIPIQCDHGKDEETKRLFDTIAKDQDGRLDILVNNAFAGVSFISEHGNKPFYEMPVEAWDIINKVGLRSNYICAYYAAQLMIPRRKGFIVNVSSAGGLLRVFNTPYGVGKEGNDRMAVDMATDIKRHNVVVISLWPGATMTEALEDHFKDNEKPDVFRETEHPTFAGKAIVALASDEKLMKKTGKIHFTSELSLEYGFTDVGGSRPYSYRQVRKIVEFSKPGWGWLIPSFLYIPRWMFYLAGMKF